ncbi:LysR family transcriptional regulator [Schlesneria paludicola]|uniref:LysR family transcriptional regulator n=1 Tax=Schlesneria paludicola TaxID=360056 RepID=UPI00029B0B0C|nr:LysR family transcriptional regulator [Schlesneria paludicola]
MIQAAIGSLTTDQVSAFVQLARQGSLRAAAEALFISEQGLRSRLLVLEGLLGAELYYKYRGPRRRSPLTPQGHQLLPYAEAFLERAIQLCNVFQETETPQELHVVASQYLIAYSLIDVIQEFHLSYPDLHVRLSARTEQEIEQSLLESQEICFGVAAPYESSPDLVYRHLFSMSWSLITPPQHQLAMKRRIRLADLEPFPLIMYERGSTGRRHVVEAFQRQSLTPRVEFEATNTDLIVRMVESGMGIAIVPLHASGAVTKGRRLAVQSLGNQVRPIDSGILMRRNDRPADSILKLQEFLNKRLKYPLKRAR